MGRSILFSGLCVFIFSMVFSQSNLQIQKNVSNGFDEAAARRQAIENHIKPSEVNGYIQFLKNDFSSKNALQSHVHASNESLMTSKEAVIYIQPNRPMSIGCPNMGFEQYNFTGWTGSTGTVTAGVNIPNYVSTGSAIINSAGSNLSVLNTINYHTIMNAAPSSAIYPYCSGYDSLACKSIGTSTVSQIAFVSPFSSDPVSVRMNSANANYRACQLKYVTTTSATNKRIVYSFAVVLQNPAVHNVGEVPYFKVEIRNETTNSILPGCNSYTLNPISATPADSLFQSASGPSYDPIMYRKWQYYSVDLSSLPPGTNVSVNFEVGGCTQSGHWGYAYVDAECGGVGNPYVNMCPGAAAATLVAPAGFNSYQWFDQTNTLIAGATNDTLIVNSPIAGDVYSVHLLSPGGCALVQTDTIKTTGVGIIGVQSAPSCTGINSGSAMVQPAGSNGSYTYTWTNTSTGFVISNSQIASSLSPGTYSAVVSSSGCGQASANINVGVSPPTLFTEYITFCGDYTYIAKPGGTNYAWYRGANAISGPSGTNDTLFISNAANASKYTLCYTNSSGCRDSIIYILNQTSGGDMYIANTIPQCTGNGSAVIHLNTISPAPYTYKIIGPGNTSILNSTLSTNTLSVSSLVAGTYYVFVNDGICNYNDTFSIGTIQTSFTATPTHTLLCSPDDTALVKINFPPPPVIMCGIDPLLCSSPGTVTLFPSGLFNQNANNTYPTPYGNYYSYGRTQFLVRKSDMNASGIFAGKISSLAFHVMSVNSSITNYPDFSIKIGCTSLSSLPNNSVSAQPFVNGLETVYSSTNQPVSQGWITHQFSQAYNWDGISNILIEVCFGTSYFSYTGNVSVELKQMPYIANMYHVEDANDVCSGTQAANSTNLMVNGAYMLPNMQFGYCPSEYVASNYTMAVSNNGAITHNSLNNDSLKIIPSYTATTIYGAPTVYTITATYPNSACVATQTVSVTLSNTCSDIWPGDANNDGTADNLDVLELGLHYMQTGAARTSTSNAWQPYNATNWTGTITNGQNVNHSDCNGDGTISVDDTLAIYNNYGLTHALKPANTYTISPQLSIIPDQASVSVGNWGTSSIYLGSTSAPVNNINGVAFTVDFDQTLIEPNGIYLQYIPSFINSANHNLHFRKTDFNNGIIYTATTHTTNANVSGNGKIAILHYRIKTTLTHDTILNIGLTQANQSNAGSVITPLSTGTASLMAIGATVGIDEITSGNTAVYPNPASDQLSITSSLELQKVELTNVTGQAIISENTSGRQHKLYLSGISNGIYFINVYSNGRIIKREKIVVQH